MNSNEIVYERKMTGSFMKLRCDEVKPLDEKILLKNNIHKPQGHTALYGL